MKKDCNGKEGEGEVEGKEKEERRSKRESCKGSWLPELID